MLISCLMMTYNRFPSHQYMVEEAIESFLRQDHPYRELIICNDTPGQRLVYRHPMVTVINVAKRFDCLADKIQLLIDAAHGDAFCWFDDDDISLPKRLSYSIEQLGERMEWHVSSHIFSHGGKLSVEGSGAGHNNAIWRRELLPLMGDYERPSNGYDQTFNSALGKAGFSCDGEDIDPTDLYYIYRWATGSVHISGHGGIGEDHYQQIGDMPVEPGIFKLTPHWRSDYVLDAFAMTSQL